MIKVYGASDDLIEVDGDIREEFNTSDGVLLFSDGTMLNVRFSRVGDWRIEVLQEGEAYVHWAQEAQDGADTDVVHLIGGHMKFVALVDRLAWVG